MIARVDLAELAKENSGRFALVPFYKNGAPLFGKNCPRWGMTLLSAGSMRFRWNESNPNRDAFFEALLSSRAESVQPSGVVRAGVHQPQGVPASAPQTKRVVPLELIHSKIVFDAKNGDETFQKQGDGIIARNKNLVPTITVGDCMPIFFFEEDSGVFGIVHSGWKGSGIIEEAIKLAEKNHGACRQKMLVAIGAHIRNCCYFVDDERAKYFSDNFGAACVQKIEGDFLNARGASENPAPDNGLKYRLSLEQANMGILARLGVLEENIVAAKNCTCCENAFGSFRRQAAFGDAPDKSKAFTAQAAFVLFD